jgi:hypothetical protein
MLDVGTIKAAEAVGTMQLVEGGSAKMEVKPRSATFVAINCHARRHDHLLIPSGTASVSPKAGTVGAAMPGTACSLSTVERKRVERRAAGGRPVMGQVFSAAWSLIAEN